MSRYIDADNAIERLGAYLMADAQIEYGGMASEDINDWKELASDILKGTPSIDLEADYVPRDYYNKVVEELCKKHAEEIASMPDIVRCKECKHWTGETEHYEDREYKACWQLCGQYVNSEFWCRYGEREGE